ncbi:competence protein CelA [Collibacillus ludicampi]|uniref:Competence protein CelA n=1 Tax=Collibacillus ludicampi TaxID=2771369 RepID=A0AAV4LIV2_9BACL|nr:ComEA family DNA-binding protein [Collibacillus ludicampi]GIM47337.1 competence protein CelA [Collibacillus ludicampi]
MLRFTRREQILLIALLVAVLFSIGIYVTLKPSREAAELPFQKTEPSEQTKQVEGKRGNTQTQSVKVDVKGSVHHPGVVSLPADSRVADAIAAAGGALENADLSKVNLAAKLVDGGQVTIPSVQQNDAHAAVTQQTGGMTADGKVDLNHATEADFDKLPGLGSSRIKAIIEYRNTHGPFQSVDDLKKVKGFGDKLIESLRDKVVVQ